MLNKLLKVAPFSRANHSKPAKLDKFSCNIAETAHHREADGSSSALRIIHEGGKVECYYMAMPAFKILEKYPYYVLAKPEVFRRPWDSVVRPEKILTPGRKFLLVPQATVDKLRRRNKKPGKDVVLSNSFASLVFGDMRKRSGSKKCVTFAGIDAKQKQSTGSEKKKKGYNTKDGSGNSQSQRRLRLSDQAWQPSLDSVTECQGN